MHFPVLIGALGFGLTLAHGLTPDPIAQLSSVFLSPEVAIKHIPGAPDLGATLLENSEHFRTHVQESLAQHLPELHNVGGDRLNPLIDSVAGYHQTQYSQMPDSIKTSRSEIYANAVYSALTDLSQNPAAMPDVRKTWVQMQAHLTNQLEKVKNDISLENNPKAYRMYTEAKKIINQASLLSPKEQITFMQKIMKDSPKNSPHSFKYINLTDVNKALQRTEHNEAPAPLLINVARPAIPHPDFASQTGQLPATQRTPHSQSAFSPVAPAVTASA